MNSQDNYGCPDPLALHKQPSSFNSAISKLVRQMALCYGIIGTNTRCTVWFDCVRACASTQSAFPIEANAIFIKSKDRHMKQKILSCSYKCC